MQLLIIGFLLGFLVTYYFRYKIEVIVDKFRRKRPEPTQSTWSPPQKTRTPHVIPTIPKKQRPKIWQK